MNEVAKYDYDLPRELIAQEPVPNRADARLMVVDRSTETIEHRHVRDLPSLISAGDCLVVNNTQVIPARLIGRRTMTGGRWEGLFLISDQNNLWKILSKTRGKIQRGETVTLVDREGQGCEELQLVERLGGGEWIAQAKSSDDAYTVLERVGRVPLPHYIRGGDMLPADLERYQTVFARHKGSVAAPTAGLHFTRDLLQRIEQQGTKLAYVTLHVGMDTFRPMTAENLKDHKMHSEWGSVDDANAALINQCRQDRKRVVGVGTTTVRILETACRGDQLEPWRGATDLFIRPPYRFGCVDVLMTNFHLPQTTLLVLACAFGGFDLIMRAYQEAVKQSYRFYSYGDAMLIL